jgi:hypothetical protein
MNLLAKSRCLVAALVLLSSLGRMRGQDVIIPPLAQKHPTDTSLKFMWLQHRSDFEKLIKMSNEDKHVVRIASDFTWLDTDVSWPRQNIGFTKERWDAYRGLFKKLDIPYGIERSARYPSATFFISSSVGLLVNGSSKGYAYSTLPLSPTRQSLDNISLAGLSGDVTFFRPVGANWYLFIEFDQ